MGMVFRKHGKKDRVKDSRAKWHHVAIVNDRSPGKGSVFSPFPYKLRVYLDGKQLHGVSKITTIVEVNELNKVILELHAALDVDIDGLSYYYKKNDKKWWQIWKK